MRESPCRLDQESSPATTHEKSMAAGGMMAPEDICLQIPHLERVSLLRLRVGLWCEVGRNPRLCRRTRNIISEVSVSESGRQEGESERGSKALHHWPWRRKKEPLTKDYGWPLEAGKSKETDPSPGVPEGSIPAHSWCEHRETRSRPLPTKWRMIHLNCWKSPSLRWLVTTA